MMNDFQGYSNFNDVQNKKLQAYNRFVVFFNVVADKDIPTAKRYLMQFSDEDKRAIKELGDRIKTEGVATVRREVLQ
jgi:hypothetical protein